MRESLCKWTQNCSINREQKSKCEIIISLYEHDFKKTSKVFKRWNILSQLETR